MITKKPIADILQDEELYKAMVFNSEYYPNKLIYEKIYWGNTYEDLSFAVSLGDKNLAVIMLTIHEGNLGFFSGPLDVILRPGIPIEEKDQFDNWLRSFFSDFIVERKITKISFQPYPVLIDLFLNSISEQKPKFVSTVDLSMTEAMIKKNARKSYRSLIHWGAREMQLVHIDSKNPDSEIFESFRQFHIQVAGRETRSIETWNKQLDMIRANEAFLLMGYMQGKLVSSLLCACGSVEAYYWVGVSDRALMAENKPLQHYLIFQAILKAKEMGLSSFNLGEIFNKQFNEKETAIAKFKKGFTSTVSLRPYLLAEFTYEE